MQKMCVIWGPKNFRQKNGSPWENPKIHVTNSLLILFHLKNKLLYYTEKFVQRDTINLKFTIVVCIHHSHQFYGVHRRIINFRCRKCIFLTKIFFQTNFLIGQIIIIMRTKIQFDQSQKFVKKKFLSKKKWSNLLVPCNII